MIAATSTTTADKLLNDLLNGGLVVVLLTLVTSLGMGFTVRQILAPLRRWVLLIAFVVVNVLVIPATAWGLSELFPLSSAHRVGLVLVISVAGAPAGLKACQLSKRADMAMAVSFIVVLQLVNIVAAPLWASAIVTGASVNVWTIVGSLLILVLIPLVVGLFMKARYGDEVTGWKVGLERASNIAVYVVIAAGIAGNWKEVVSILGSWVILFSVVIILVTTALGALVGLKDPTTRITSGLLSGMRFTPIGFIVITSQLHGQGKYLAPALVYGLIDTIIPFALGVEIGHQHAKHQAADGNAKHQSAEPKVAAPVAAHAPTTT